MPDAYEFTAMDGTDLPASLREPAQPNPYRPFSPAQRDYLHSLIQSIRANPFHSRKQTP